MRCGVLATVVVAVACSGSGSVEEAVREQLPIGGYFVTVPPGFHYEMLGDPEVVDVTGEEVGEGTATARVVFDTEASSDEGGAPVRCEGLAVLEGGDDEWTVVGLRIDACEPV